MIQVFQILLAGGLIATVSLLLGNTFLRAVNAPLRRSEARFLAFVIGAALFAAVIFGLASAGLARRGVFLAISALLIAACVWRGGHRFPKDDFPPLTGLCRIVLTCLYGGFGVLYLLTALQPESSLDGSTHYVQQALFTARDFRGAPDGIGSLFLFAFAIGRHSAVAVTELLFLLATPLGILAYARRINQSRAGVAGAMLFFLSPIAGFTGTIAAPDLAVACAAFALFYALHLKPRILIAPLLGWFAWVAGPWLLREFDKPILHLNAWYPRLPLDLTVLGERVNGFAGPIFLLTPLALLALRSTAGRRLLLAAAIFAAPCIGAMETRALIAALPFLSLSLALVLTEWTLAAPAVLIAHTLLSIPGITALYADEKTPRLKAPDWRAALRWESEDAYLMRALPGYYTGRLLESMVADDAPILALSPFQQVYHTRRIIDGQQSDAGRRVRDILSTAFQTDREPVERYEFRFPERPVRTLTLTPEDFSREARWGVNEIHVLRGSVELPHAGWQASATPNPAFAPFAIDANSATRWSSGRAYADQMRLEIDLGSAQPVDQVIVEASSDQGRSMNLALDTGTFASLRAADQPLPAEIRTQAMAAVKQEGIRWLLVNANDPGASDFTRHAAEWNLDLRSTVEGYAIFQLK